MSRTIGWLLAGIGVGVVLGAGALLATPAFGGRENRARLRRLFGRAPSDDERAQAYDDLRHEARRMMKH